MPPATKQMPFQSNFIVTTQYTLHWWWWGLLLLLLLFWFFGDGAFLVYSRKILTLVWPSLFHHLYFYYAHYIKHSLCLPSIVCPCQFDSGKWHNIICVYGTSVFEHIQNVNSSVDAIQYTSESYKYRTKRRYTKINRYCTLAGFRTSVVHSLFCVDSWYKGFIFQNLNQNLEIQNTFFSLYKMRIFLA